MEDWRIVDGGAEVQSGGGNRNIHLITHQLTDPGAGFESEVTVQRVEQGPKDGGVGFRVGIKSEINEHRSNAFANGGIQAGLRDGKIFLAGSSAEIELDLSEPVTLRLSAKPADGKVRLTISVNGVSISSNFDSEKLRGNIAVVSNFDGKLKKNQGARYRFTNWTASGEAFQIDESRRFGPILWGMYSLSDSRSDEGFVLKVSALTGPLGEKGQSKR